MPERIANAPELLPWLVPVMEAFYELSTCRVQDLGPIPWNAIQEYARVTGMEPYRLTRLIREVDAVYIAKQREKAKKPIPQKQEKPPKDKIGR